LSEGGNLSDFSMFSACCEPSVRQSHGRVSQQIGSPGLGQRRKHWSRMESKVIQRQKPLVKGSSGRSYQKLERFGQLNWLVGSFTGHMKRSSG